MAYKFKTKYVIELELGSEFQKEVALKWIEAMLSVSKSSIESKHINNKFNYYAKA